MPIDAIAAPAGSLRVFKYDALGNTYLVVDARQDIAAALLETAEDAPALKASIVRGLCAEATGIGSNGLLFGPVAHYKSGRFDVRIVNSDGTFAGFSGNGTRIFARYLLDTGDVRAGTSFEIAVQDGIAGRNIVSVEIAKGDPPIIAITAPQAPRFGLDAVAANPAVVIAKRHEGAAYTVPGLATLGAQITAAADAWSSSTLVDIGNPHCVTFVKDRAFLPTSGQLTDADTILRSIAFRRNDASQAAFAAGINLQWAWAESRTRLHLIIYERGEGPTPASGSSASAAACAAFARGLVNSQPDVIMPGGTLTIRIEGQPQAITSVKLTGTASRVLETTISAKAISKMSRG